MTPPLTTRIPAADLLRVTVLDAEPRHGRPTMTTNPAENLRRRIHDLEVHRRDLLGLIASEGQLWPAKLANWERALAWVNGRIDYLNALLETAGGMFAPKKGACNREFGHEAFCVRPKGHTGPCSTRFDPSEYAEG